MKSAILLKPGQIEIRTQPDPVPGPGEIVLRIESALTCGTTLKTYIRGHSKIKMPGPFGHEYAGHVALVGPGVNSISAGDRVVCLHTAYCGKCRYCQRGQTALCQNFDKNILMGAFAEKIKVTASIVDQYCFQIPDNISFCRAAFLQSVSCVVHGLRKLALKKNEPICILGTGSFSILFALVLRSWDMEPVLLGRNLMKCQAIKHFGFKATHTPDELQALLGGVPPLCVIEAVGTAQAWLQAVDLVDRGGRVLWFGGLPSEAEVSIPHQKIHYGEIQLCNAFHYTPEDVEIARKLLWDTLDPDFIIGATLSLENLEKAFKHMAGGRGLKYEIIP